MSAPFALTWRLRECMQAQGMAHIVDLEHALQAIGVRISAVQLGRMVQGPPKHLPLDLLPALLTVLRCEPGDLLAWQPAQSGDASKRVPTVRGPRRRVANTAAPALSEAERAQLVGPPLRGLPARTLKREAG